MTTRRAFLRSLLQLPDAYTETADLTDDYWLFGHKDGEEYGRRFRPSKLKTIVGGGGSTLPPMRNAQTLAQFASGPFNLASNNRFVKKFTFNIVYPGMYAYSLLLDAEMGIWTRNDSSGGGVYRVLVDYRLNNVTFGTRQAMAVHYVIPYIRAESQGTAASLAITGFSSISAGQNTFDVWGYYQSDPRHEVYYSRLQNIYCQLVEVPRVVVE